MEAERARGARVEEQTVRLRDGTSARVRPVVPDDADALRRGLAELSPASRQARFLSPVSTLSDAQVRSLVDVDGVDHVALVVCAPANEPDERPIAIGRIVRYPDDPAVADLAITVADAWQRRGVGTRLAELLAQHRPLGVRRIRTMISTGNSSALKLARRMGHVRLGAAGSGSYEVDITPFDS